VQVLLSSFVASSSSFSSGVKVIITINIEIILLIGNYATIDADVFITLQSILIILGEERPP